jgi:hypothetical protein
MAMSGNMSKRFEYDDASGQVFAESSIRISRQHGSDWIGEYKTPSLLKKTTPRNAYAARSLQEIANAQVARNMRSLTPDHLRDMPWAVAEKLWDEIVSIHGESFHAWRTLASSHGDNFNTLRYRYYIEIRRPPLPFADYFKGLTSPSLDWLTCLRIAPKYADKADLVKIAGISNLAILDLSDSLDTVELSPSNFDERIFRTWAELALHEGAFKHLRALLFGWQPAISTWMFKYLNSFPALRLLVVTACPEFGQSNRKAWEPIATETHWEARHAKKSVQLMRTVINEENFYFGAVSSMLFDAAIFGPRISKKPVLECWLGGPPAWENVQTVFPKATQTVWLEKVDATASSVQPQKIVDQSKRLRDAEVISKEARSPPPKRTNTKVRSNITTKTAAGLLGEFSNGA